MKIYKMKKMSLPKVAVLATGLTAAVLVGTMSPQAANATPSRGTTCSMCHPIGGSVTATPSSATVAANAAYTVAIVLTTTATGNSGYSITGNGMTPILGNPVAGTTHSAAMTAPAAAGSYTYTVNANQGSTSAGQASATTYSITVTAGTGATTTAPATTAPATTTAPADPTTTTAPVVVAGVSAVIPVGAPNTGAGGAAGSNDGLMGLGGLTLLLAGAGATTVIRRRRQA